MSAMLTDGTTGGEQQVYSINAASHSMIRISTKDVQRVIMKIEIELG